MFDKFRILDFLNFRNAKCTHSRVTEYDYYRAVVGKFYQLVTNRVRKRLRRTHATLAKRTVTRGASGQITRLT